MKTNKSEEEMNRSEIRRLIHIVSVAFVLIIGICGCDDDKSVGLSVRPEVDNIHVTADTFVLECDNYEIPSISAQADTMVLGEFYSPTYGTTKAELLVQLNAPDDYVFPPDSLKPQPDSLVLILYYNDYFGSPYAPLEFSVYEINKKSINYSERYYSDLDPGEFCDSSILMGKRVMTSIDLSRRDTASEDTAEVGYVRYKLDQVQMQRFYDMVSKNKTISSESFLNDFKGMYITTRFGSSTLLYLHQITMYLYYHYTYKKAGVDTIVKTSIIFPANHEVRQLNHFEHPNRHEIVEGIPDSLLYVKSAAGIYPRMTLPMSRIRRRMRSRMDSTDVPNISAAEVALECIEYDEKDVYMDPPGYMLAIDERKLDDFLKHQSVPDGTEADRVLGTYSAKADAYTFDFTYLLTKRLEMDKSEDEDIRFVFVPVDVRYSSTTVVAVQPLVKLAATKVRSAKNGNSPFRMKVLYEGY